jgi:serine/threonine-protein kinase
MSPEQCSQTQPLDARSDIYSLGVILYEMLAGRVPFTGESATIIMMKQGQDTPPSILATRPDLPAGISEVITRALAKHSADRFQTAGDLFAALSSAADGVSAPRAAETVATEPVVPPSDDLDEETVVRPRQTFQYTPGAAGAEPVADFRPWRIIVPSAIVLVVVFGIVFLLTRGASPTQTNQTQGQGQPGLTADPNSQPVQASSPATGASEHGIESLPGANALPSASPTANPKQTPVDVLGNYSANSNSNDNTFGRGNKNSNQPSESPSPRAKPSASVENQSEPPPKPSPTIRTVTKPSSTPPGESR